jgi:hypothetical protein
MLSVRMTEATLETLASYALNHSTTQRRVIAEALAAHGVRVAARELEDRWAGRGRKPQWVEDKLAHGATLNAMWREIGTRGRTGGPPPPRCRTGW